MNLFSAFATDVAIDLGTANTCIFARGRGIVLNEPSIVAFNTAKGAIEAVGTEAHEMLGRTPANIKPVRPMKDGVIADFEAAEKMLTHFVRKAQGGRPLRRPRLVIGVPPEITQVERRAVKDSGFRVKASEVHLVDEPMAAAIGSGLPVTEAAGNMIIDIGGGTTDIAVISLAGTVYGRSLRVAGNALDEAIMQYMREAHNLLIGERTAEQIKCEVGSAAPLEIPLTMEVKGRHLLEGVPRTVHIPDSEIREALAEPVRLIVSGGARRAGAHPAGALRRHLRSRRGPDRRRRAAPQPRPASPRRNGAAGDGGREPVDLGRPRRRQDAHGPAAAPQGLNRLRLLRC